MYIRTKTYAVCKIVPYTCSLRLTPIGMFIVIAYLIEQVDLGDGVGGVPRVPHQYHHQLHKGIHRMVALGTSHCAIDGLGECVCEREKGSAFVVEE